MEYHIGQDVVCINNKRLEHRLEQGKVYTIRSLKTFECKCGLGIDVGINSNLFAREQVTCRLCNHQRIIDSQWYLKADRFKPLDELTNITELTEILEQPIYEDK
jgi:hypothetical protein